MELTLRLIETFVDSGRFTGKQALNHFSPINTESSKSLNKIRGSYEKLNIVSYQNLSNLYAI